jgi:hypothetical protein
VSAPARRAIWGGLVLAGLFTVCAGLTTQVHWLRSGSSWQDDPYDAIVSFTQFMVPALAAVTLVRLLIRRTSFSEDVRVAQLLRATMLSLATVALTLVADWVAVVLAADHELWNSRTPGLVIGLVVLTLLMVAQGAALTEALRSTAWRASQFDGDWLADLALLVPGLLTPARAEFLRRHVLAISVLVASLASAGVTGALTLGERWTDPLLIGWAFVVQGGSYFAFCLVANRLLTLAQRSGPVHSAAEIAAVSGSLAVGVAVALRDPLWQLLDGHDVDTMQQLVGLTLGAGIVVAVVAYPLARMAGGPVRPSGRGV